LFDKRDMMALLRGAQPLGKVMDPNQMAVL
jgi:hypothetical protein